MWKCRKPSGTLQVLPVKVALTVLSSAELQMKYQYLFSQLANHNNCISSNKLEILLKNITCITEYLNESTAFGSKFITSTVESCFQQVDHQHLYWMEHFTSSILANVSGCQCSNVSVSVSVM
jgi:hypothetical protein